MKVYDAREDGGFPFLSRRSPAGPPTSATGLRAPRPARLRRQRSRNSAQSSHAKRCTEGPCPQAREVRETPPAPDIAHKRAGHNRGGAQVMPPQRTATAGRRAMSGGLMAMTISPGLTQSSCGLGGRVAVRSKRLTNDDVDTPGRRPSGPATTFFRASIHQPGRPKPPRTSSSMRPRASSATRAPSPSASRPTSRSTSARPTPRSA